MVFILRTIVTICLWVLYRMNTILGIKFREYGQIYYFLAGQCAPAIGDRVIVETEQGQGIGEVVLIRDTVPASVLPEASGTNSEASGTGFLSDMVDAATPALLITNTTTSAVIIPNSDLTVADIPYASAVVAKVQALKQDQQAVDFGTALEDFESSESPAPEVSHSIDSMTERAFSHEDNDEQNCCNHGSCQHGSNDAPSSQENLDGVLVASSEIESINAPIGAVDSIDSVASEGQAITDNCAGDGTALDSGVHGGRMVSYDGSAGEHNSDSQVPEDTSQPLSFDDLRPILRIATEYDLEHAMSNELLSREASTYCKECIKMRELDMKLVDVEVFFDLSKFIFYFTAPSRIDFRELVKDLVKHYRTRIELRQIGVRHETQMIGAVGNCGMVCCCRRFLRKFAPVTIKMAKEQNLFLNPAKISGICGRLLCCLSYEQENYEEFHRRCPRLGKKYMTSKGPIKVMRANMFRNSLIAYSETGEELEIPLEEWHDMEVRRPDSVQQAPKASRRDKTNGAPEKGTSSSTSPAENEASEQDKTTVKQDFTKKPVLGCTGACERCGECGPSGAPTKRPLASTELGRAVSAEAYGHMHNAEPQGLELKTGQAVSNTTLASTPTKQAESGQEDSRDSKSAPNIVKPIQASVHDAEQVMASLSGVHQPPSAVSEHGIPTTQARQAALVQSLAGMDGGPLCSIAQPDKPVTPAVIAAHVIGDVVTAAEVAAKQAPASIAMPERLIKSTDTSALKTSRGRRKRRRKPRDGGQNDAFEQGNPDFYDNDMD